MNKNKKTENRFLDVLGMCKGMGIGIALAVLGILAMASVAAAAPSSGTVWTWGFNANGELGDGTTTNRLTPVQVGSLTDVIKIAGGDANTVALKSDGTVWTWGSNEHGQLGDGTKTDEWTNTDKWTPVQVSGLTNVIAIAGGGSGYTIALKSDGTVWDWGYNCCGQLGDNTSINRWTPVQVSGLTNVIAIAGGNFQTLALKSDGTVWAWGLNRYGELGDGTATIRRIPILVSGLTNVIAISGGYFYSAALKSDGTVWTWGLNDYGQLGDNTSINRWTPVQVSRLTNVIAIATGGGHTTALRSDGTVWDWGYPSGAGSRIPVQVIGLTNITKIASGGSHTIALKSDGTVWTWGWNDFGQLGDGTTTPRLAPTQVSNLTNVIAIAGGSVHTIAIVSATPTPTPTPEFKFAHVTDVHIGYYVDPSGDFGQTPSMEQSVTSFTDILQSIKNRKDVNFTVITGDLVQQREPEFFMAFKNLVRGFDVKITPGNHDRRKLFWGNDLTNYREILNPLNPVQPGEVDWNFSYNGYNFIGLDSGADYSMNTLPDCSTTSLSECFKNTYNLLFESTPESDGLTDSQWNKLNSGEFSNGSQRQIIFMHGPAMDTDNDTYFGDQVSPVPPNGPGGNNNAIANHRANLINYAINNRVDMVLTGHTHRDEVFDASGNNVSETTAIRPLFIQTRNNAYRVIDVKDGNATPSEPIVPTKEDIKNMEHISSALWFNDVDERYDLHAYDSHRRHTGMVACSGDFELGIPDSYFTGNYGGSSDKPQVLVVYSSDGITMGYKITEFEVSSTCMPNSAVNANTPNTAVSGLSAITSSQSSENTTFSQTITDRTDTSTTQASFYNVTVGSNSTATVNVSDPLIYIMEVDMTSDGTVDRIVYPDSISTRFAQPQRNASIIVYNRAGIINLSASSGNFLNAASVNESMIPDKQENKFPYGLMRFEINHLTNGSTVSISMELPQNLPTNAQYWKYGRTLDNDMSHWYLIPIESNDGDNRITIQLQDGGLGDDDLEVNGRITDDGGPSVADSQPTITITVPANGTSYVLNQIVISNWSATDESGITTVTATTPNGTAIDTTTVGLKNFTVTVTDTAGNTVTKTITYNVVAAPDTEAPVITILGNNPEKVNVDVTYTDAGATANDAVDGLVPVTPVSTVNTAIAGAYTVTYTATDAAGNSATATRTVNVVSAPTSRKADVTFKVYKMDGKKQKPLSDAIVSLDGVKKKTNDYGIVTFKKVALGTHKYVVRKEGYSTVTSSIGVTADKTVTVIMKRKQSNEHED